MKKIVLIIVISVNLYALSATTKSGYFACTSEESFKDMTKFKIAKDYDSMQAYIQRNKCLLLKKGVAVTILDVSFSGTSQFAFQGVKFWTNTEALDIK